MPFGILGALGLFGSSQKPNVPQQSFGAADINRLIDAYRQQGLEGIRTQGMRAQAQAASQLAASGLEPSLALQQALYTPILEQLSGARIGLEGQLAGTQGNLLGQLSSERFRAQLAANLAQYQAQQDFFKGFTDLGGTALLGLT